MSVILGESLQLSEPQFSPMSHGLRAAARIAKSVSGAVGLAVAGAPAGVTRSLHAARVQAGGNRMKQEVEVGGGNLESQSQTLPDHRS